MWVIKFANKEISVTLPLQNLANFGKFREILYQQKKLITLKVVSATFLLICFLSLNKSTCQTRKNVLCFTSKALFILEKIKFYYIFKFHDVIKCLSIKQKTHFTE